MKSHSEGFLRLVLQAQKHITEINITQAQKQLILNKAVFIDVREKTEFDTGYIPKAIHLSKGIIERDIEKVMPDYSAYLILYCSGGFRSAIAADSLQKMGYKNVYSLAGGTSAWVNAGYRLII